MVRALSGGLQGGMGWSEVGLMRGSEVSEVLSLIRIRVRRVGERRRLSLRRRRRSVPRRRLEGRRRLLLFSSSSSSNHLVRPLRNNHRKVMIADLTHPSLVRVVRLRRLRRMQRLLVFVRVGFVQRRTLLLRHLEKGPKRFAC